MDSFTKNLRKKITNIYINCSLKMSNDYNYIISEFTIQCFPLIPLISYTMFSINII